MGNNLSNEEFILINDLLYDFNIKINKKAIIEWVNNISGSETVYIDNDEKYFLKKINKNYTLKRINFFLDYQNKLYNNGIPCPKLFSTTKGNLYSKIGNNFYYLQNFCDGKSYWWDDLPSETRLIHRKQIGSLLGNIHCTLSNRNLIEFQPSISTDIKILLNYPHQIISSLTNSFFRTIANRLWIMAHWPSSLEKRLIKLLPELKHLFSQLSSHPQYKELDYLEPIPSHGDWNHENLLFKNSTLSCLIDFDNARFVPRAYDIGSALATICFLGEHENDFLSAYELTSGLKRPDPQVIRVCVFIRTANSLIWQLDNFSKLHKTQKEKYEWWILQLFASLEKEMFHHL